MNKKDRPHYRRPQGTKKIAQTITFDSGPEEPDLLQYKGYSDCETCAYRKSFLERICTTISGCMEGVSKINFSFDGVSKEPDRSLHDGFFDCDNCYYLNSFLGRKYKRITIEGSNLLMPNEDPLFFLSKHQCPGFRTLKASTRS